MPRVTVTASECGRVIVQRSVRATVSAELLVESHAGIIWRTPKSTGCVEKCHATHAWGSARTSIESEGGRLVRLPQLGETT